MQGTCNFTDTDPEPTSDQYLQGGVVFMQVSKQKVVAIHHMVL